ncbi:MAG: imidazoleglycerol-phosphate dehydratase [Chloroflexi bacterium]|nr:imidazoleglycerol-phosphate dehydratase [Chloroflexota bacterium]|tara:strand:- start:22362 stop:22958 length:597 start_codon:yes stop_codon:yes gene_type:complete
MKQRKAQIKRKTKETDISIKINLDGKGLSSISTGNGFLDHLLNQIPRHGLIDLEIKAVGDIETGWHHTVEDVGISLGKAFKDAIGEARGIVRMGHALVPLDEALAQVAIDISGRGHGEIDAKFAHASVEGLPSDLIKHFLEAFATEAKITLHANILTGLNDHHKAEAIFKAFAKALMNAITIDQRRKNEIPSTKGTLT